MSSAPSSTYEVLSSPSPAAENLEERARQALSNMRLSASNSGTTQNISFSVLSSQNTTQDTSSNAPSSFYDFPDTHSQNISVREEPINFSAIIPPSQQHLQNELAARGVKLSWEIAAMFDAVPVGTRTQLQLKKRPWPDPQMDAQARNINDNVHGFLRVHFPLNKLINKPEMQRLHRLRQMPTPYNDFPSATHTRFSHAIGVYYLTYQTVTHLARDHANNITDGQKLALCIAALCHDWGQGPLTYLFANYNLSLEIAAKTKIGRGNEPCGRWESQSFLTNPLRSFNAREQSIRLLKRRFELEPALKEIFDVYLTESDYALIEEALYPRAYRDRFKTVNGIRTWVMRGCGERENFLLDIVYNQDCGFDNCKMDYHIRDTLAMGKRSSFDVAAVDRLRQNCFAAVGKDNIRCVHYDVKTLNNILDMAKTQIENRINDYNRFGSLSLEFVLLNIFSEFGDRIFYRNDENPPKMISLKDVAVDLSAFVKTSDDSIFHEIFNSMDPSMRKAQEMLTLHESGRYYDVVAIFSNPGRYSREEIEDEIEKHSDGRLSRDQFLVYVKNVLTYIHPLKVPLHENRTPTNLLTESEVRERCGSNVLSQFFRAFIFVPPGTDADLWNLIARTCEKCGKPGRTIQTRRAPPMEGTVVHRSAQGEMDLLERD